MEGNIRASIARYESWVRRLSNLKAGARRLGFWTQRNPRLAGHAFSALRRLGKRVEFARYEGEGHWQGTWTIANQRDYLQRMIA